MDELKRCPFCGGEEIITDVDKDNSVPQFAVSTVSVRCKKCGAKISSPPMRSQVEAQKMIYAAWNRRAEGWISVTELPEKTMSCNVLVGGTYPRSVSGYYDARETAWYTACGTSFSKDGRVTHWMPLPQPPKKGE